MFKKVQSTRLSFLCIIKKLVWSVQLDHLEEEEIENNSSHEFDEEEHLKRVENMKSVHQQVRTDRLVCFTFFASL